MNNWDYNTYEVTIYHPANGLVVKCIKAEHWTDAIVQASKDLGAGLIPPMVTVRILKDV